MCVTNTCEYYWGCVSGDSEIYVKTMSLLEPGSMDYITMEELWKKLKKRKISHNGIKEQPAGPDYLYCDTEGLYVYDIRKPGFVKVTRVIRNKTKQWRVITLSHKDTVYTITCTLDHPFPTVDEDGKDVRLSADKLKKGHQIRVEKPKKDDKYAIDINKETISEQKPDIVLATITSIEDKTVEGYSYDLTTESDHFTVNHIDSHNCRAFLSPYYERGGFYPADENDKPVFTGRWNGGVVSLHLPMILAKARKESKDFYEVLNYYLELIRNIHKRTRDYLGEMKASVNPLQFCEGGFYRGHLKPTDKIKPLLDYVTFSYGITALNELNRLYNGKSIREDGEFPLEVMEYINKKLDQFKKEDHILYAVYSTPAESLCTEGNTLVQTVDGYKKIKDIKAGDEVFSYNYPLHAVELKKVVWAMKTQSNVKVLNVKMSDGQEYKCTPNHPFAWIGSDKDTDENGRPAHQNNVAANYIAYIPARLLRPGDKIQTMHFKDIQVESVEELEEAFDVYNMEVEDNHNYFIGEYNGVFEGGKDSILVHNCGTQVKQFRKMYGIIENVSDREYVSNSFHCHVSEDMDPIEKQDKEHRFWDLTQGGRIQYVKYPIDYNYEAMATLVRRAMKMGLYEGVNMSLSYCDNCGHAELEMDECPKCKSKDIISINRMNGYLSYSRIHGDTMLNDAKMAEIRDRKSM